MTIAASLLPEFDHEMASSRRVLERVPEAQAGWKPHNKSYSLGDLAAHVAQLPLWISVMLGQPELDLASPEAQDGMERRFTTTADLLARFDRTIAEARTALARASDADMMAPWTLRNGRAPIFTLPRVGVLRSFVMNHLIHHRGQLTVYLRLRDVPLPGMYGPTADEAGFGS
ncbi:MAG: DinB family protein [Gemmatimonadales bacterium]